MLKDVINRWKTNKVKTSTFSLFFFTSSTEPFHFIVNRKNVYWILCNIFHPLIKMLSNGLVFMSTCCSFDGRYKKFLHSLCFCSFFFHFCSLQCKHCETFVPYFHNNKKTDYSIHLNDINIEYFYENLTVQLILIDNTSIIYL